MHPKPYLSLTYSLTPIQTLRTLGNKCDLDTQADVDKNQLDRFCTEKGDSRYQHTLDHILSTHSRIYHIHKCHIDLRIHPLHCCCTADQGFLKWFDVSAKANINIDKAARFLVERILGDTFYQYIFPIHLPTHLINASYL